MFRIGILGCGKMGRIYARFFSQNEHAKVTAFYNRTTSKAQEIAAVYDADVFDDWKKLVSDPDIDMIGICTPSHEHHAQLRECIAHGKHVLVEKPLAATAAEAEEMAAAALSSDLKVLVGFQMRFHPVIEKVNELLKNAGDIYSVDFYFGMYRPEVNWRHKREQGGGVLKELGSHLIDLSCMWLGAPSYVSSTDRTLGAGREVEDFSQTIIEFKHGALASISCNYWDRNGRAIHGRIIAENMQINFRFSSYEIADSEVMLYDEAGAHEIAIAIPDEDTIAEAYPGHLDSFKKEIDYFVEAARGDTDISASIIEGLQSMQITAAAYRSQRERLFIDLGQYNNNALGGG